MNLATKLKLIMPALIILFSAAGPPSPLVSAGMKQISKNENKTISKAVMNSAMADAATQSKPSAGTKGGSTSDIMIVDPKEVAKDWKQAFNMLKVKQTGSLTFHLANGEQISQIVDIDPLEGGYLMFFTLKNLHGLQYKIIKTSEIESLSTK
jgi:hypothetical protein